jgi:hypothetical protein
MCAARVAGGVRRALAALLRAAAAAGGGGGGAGALAPAEQPAAAADLGGGRCLPGRHAHASRERGLARPGAINDRPAQLTRPRPAQLTRPRPAPLINTPRAGRLTQASEGLWFGRAIYGVLPPLAANPESEPTMWATEGVSVLAPHDTGQEGAGEDAAAAAAAAVSLSFACSGSPCLRHCVHGGSIGGGGGGGCAPGAGVVRCDDRDAAAAGGRHRPPGLRDRHRVRAHLPVSAPLLLFGVGVFRWHHTRQRASSKRRPGSELAAGIPEVADVFLPLQVWAAERLRGSVPRGAQAAAARVRLAWPAPPRHPGGPRELRATGTYGCGWR